MNATTRCGVITIQYGALSVTVGAPDLQEVRAQVARYTPKIRQRVMHSVCLTLAKSTSKPLKSRAFKPTFDETRQELMLWHVLEPSSLTPSGEDHKTVGD
jgi:hypothetical protein